MGKNDLDISVAGAVSTIILLAIFIIVINSLPIQTGLEKSIGFIFLGTILIIIVVVLFKILDWFGI